MLSINDNLPHIQRAKVIHTARITCYLHRKIYGKKSGYVCGDLSCVICNSGMQRASISPHLYEVLINMDLKTLVSADPHELLSLHQLFEALYGRSSVSGKDMNGLARIFNYDDWFNKKNDQYDAYELCQNLQIESCIYCNRLYTSTVITDKNKRIIRPTLDHWFTKSDYPILALSFYNLIPSCSPCNSSVKHSNPFTLDDNLHPYFDQKMTGKYKLQAVYDKSLKTFKVIVDSKDDRVKNTFAAMETAEIYKHHQSELADLDLIKRKYNKKYLKELVNLLGVTMDEKDVYRIMFGVEYEDENFHKRPLSKLKKDILTR